MGFGPWSSLLPLRHLQGGGKHIDPLRSAQATQAQVVHVHISMATTITFVIHLVMNGESPPSNMCTTTTNDIYYELKCDNATINMKMLEMRLPTSPNKPYFMPSPNFMSTREDHETSTTKMAQWLLPPPLWHLCQVLSRHLCPRTSGISAYFP